MRQTAVKSSQNGLARCFRVLDIVASEQPQKARKNADRVNFTRGSIDKMAFTSVKYIDVFQADDLCPFEDIVEDAARGKNAFSKLLSPKRAKTRWLVNKLRNFVPVYFVFDFRPIHTANLQLRNTALGCSSLALVPNRVCMLPKRLRAGTGGRISEGASVPLSYYNALPAYRYCGFWGV